MKSQSSLSFLLLESGKSSFALFFLGKQEGDNSGNRTEAHYMEKRGLILLFHERNFAIFYVLLIRSYEKLAVTLE